MLIDVLKETSWESVTKGIRMYRIQPGKGVAMGEYPAKEDRALEQNLELFFCCSGSVVFRRKNNKNLVVSKEDIVLLSDFHDLTAISVESSPAGYCMRIEPEASILLETIYQAAGCEIQVRAQIRQMMDQCGGYLRFKHSYWNQSIFSVLRSLPESDQGSYCVLKAAELFYLLSTHQGMFGEIRQNPPMPGYLADTLRSIGNYIENHLDEDLTITRLCRKFNLSPTTLKNKFREFYGQPVHRWILFRRIRRAAELLQFTDLTVLQIAQGVGYESTSQFNVAFQKIYGASPSAYRKNVRYSI